MNTSLAWNILGNKKNEYIFQWCIMRNYKKEAIPSVEILIKDSKRDFKNLRKFKYTDIYIKTKKGEISRNNEFISNNLTYNSKLHGSDKYFNEIKGLYIFFEDNKPVYIGISKTILRRLKQHFDGKNHNESTLVYIMALIEYRKKHKKDFTENRIKFPYNDFRIKIQNRIKKKWQIAIIPETDNYHLYFQEIYYACLLKTRWNSFETH